MNSEQLGMAAKTFRIVLRYQPKPMTSAPTERQARPDSLIAKLVAGSYFHDVWAKPAGEQRCAAPTALHELTRK